MPAIDSVYDPSWRLSCEAAEAKQRADGHDDTFLLPRTPFCSPKIN
jgi:hypothetical protein